MMATNFQSSKETTNFARICRLVIDVIPDLLRDLLTTRLPVLSTVLTNQRNNIFHLLNGNQKKILYPHGGVYQGSVKDLDTSVLYILLRNLGNIPPHQNRWGNPPNSADRSLSANIDRLREQRNKAAHATGASLSDVEFKARWSIIRQSVEEIQNGELNTGKFVVAVDGMLTIEMDDRMTNKYIADLLSDIKDDITDISGKLVTMETDMADVQAQREESKEEVTTRQDDGSDSTSIKHGHVSSEDWDLKDMYDACQSGDKERFFRIHEKVPALFTENNGPCLLRITESGNIDLFIAVKSLLREGKGEEECQQNIANFIDADKETMLHKACRSGNRDMYEYLSDTYPSLIACVDKSSLLQLTCELNKADIMSVVLPSVEDENEIDKCLTQYQLDDCCKQAVVFELKQRIADKFNLDDSYRIEPTLNDVGEVVFLAYGLSVVRERVEKFAGMKVLFRNPKQVNDEAIRIANSDEMRTLNTNNIQGMEFAERAIQLEGTRLMEAHSNINALGVSHLRSREGGKVLKTAGTILVVIYCNSKGFRPIQEDIFPHQLLVDDVVVLTDVREGFFEIAPQPYLAIPSSHFHSKLKMGCECDVEDKEKRRGGTIGPFVKIHSKKDGDLNGFLTCAHVAYGLEYGEDIYSYDEINTPDQLQVNQPAVVDFPMPQQIIPYDPKCGKTYRGTFGKIVDGVTIDAAVVVVEKDRMPSGGEFAILRPNQLREIGFKTFPVFDSAEQADATQIMNEEIVKFGAMTHATKGVYVSLIHVKEPILMGIVGPTGLKERRFEMKGQLEISSCTANERFFALGDSGSGVFVKKGDDLRCLGLGIGCLSNGSAVVTPIEPILKALGVKLMKFTEPMDESQ